MTIEPDVDVVVVLTTERSTITTAPDFRQELREGLRRCLAGPARHQS